MGWVKEEVIPTKRIINHIISIRPTWNGVLKDSSSPYEYWADYIRDNYDVTLKQCEEICWALKEYYNIKKFYYTD